MLAAVLALTVLALGFGLTLGYAAIRFKVEGDPLVDKGVGWNLGRTFFGEEEVYRFDLVPEPGHKRPGMINVQQYHLEEALVAFARAAGEPAESRWLA